MKRPILLVAALARSRSPRATRHAGNAAAHRSRRRAPSRASISRWIDTVGEARRRLRRLRQRRVAEDRRDSRDRTARASGLLGDQRRRPQKREPSSSRHRQVPNPAAGPDERAHRRLLRRLHRHRRDRARGLAPLKPTLDRIDAIQTSAALAAALGATRCAPTSIRSTPPISTPRTCSACSSPRRSSDRRTTCPICCRAGSACPTAIIISPTPDMAQSATAYHAYVAEMLTLAGIADAEARARARSSRSR